MLAESAEIHDTCIRPRGVFVAACSIWSHACARVQLSAMQHQSSSQRVGALLIHRPAWVDQHTSGSPLTPTVHRCPKGMAVGGPCDQTAQQYSAETPQTCSRAWKPRTPIIRRFFCDAEKISVVPSARMTHNWRFFFFSVERCRTG